MAVGLRELWSDSAQRRPASFQLTPGISRACSQQLEPLLTSIQYKTGMIIKGYILPKKAGNKGEFQWTSGLQYTGEYKDNKREGYGEVVWPDGSRYEGYFHHDVREGHGKHTWGDSGEVRECVAKVTSKAYIFNMHRFMKESIIMTRGMDRELTSGLLGPFSQDILQMTSKLEKVSSFHLKEKNLR